VHQVRLVEVLVGRERLRALASAQVAADVSVEQPALVLIDDREVGDEFAINIVGAPVRAGLAGPRDDDRADESRVCG
jgi:hypothetical protein